MTTSYSFADEVENEEPGDGESEGDGGNGSADDSGQSPAEGSNEEQSQSEDTGQDDGSQNEPSSDGSGGGGSPDGGGGSAASPPPATPTDGKRKKEWQKKKAALKAKKAAAKVGPPRGKKPPVKVARAVTRKRPTPQRRRGRFGEILEEQAGFGLDSYKEDVDAINAYFVRTPAKNADASSVAVEWAVFRQKYDNAGWFNQRFSQNLWNEARGLRDKYNAANGDKLPSEMAKTALKAEDLEQAQPLGGMLGTLPSDLADKGAVALWSHLPLAGKALLGGVAGLMVYKVIK